ncbi:pseudaminic acid synthase [Microbacterium sp. CFH 90308]|uniref:Pseudaminic acid synthase n=1 Tax=Microbacterium salsuginis TaxID=2722803 RepID=A0ABX1KAA1_9MICO|nr:pseudaminic acid synthase [Microbacterium sp. CFH 90308]NLP83942.1 pseudaminic acid synthase [Microbacterium sp. CFH 90308]
MNPDVITVSGRPIGPNHPPFIIAEVSGNHGGDLSRALAIIDAAADAGADAVKFQTYTADTITIDVDTPPFRVSDEHGLWGGRTLYDLYTEAHTPWDWHRPMFERARQRALIPFSSPFDRTAVELLEGLDAPLYKIASLEVGDTELLRTVAATGKPVILSNGATNLPELAEAVATLRDAGAQDIVVLSCVSSYPADPREANVRSIPTLRDALEVQVGFSDHSAGIGAAVAAVAFGATVVEKHLTLSRADGGVDAAFSLEPDEFALLTRESRRAWDAVGSATPKMTEGETESRRLRRSLWVVKDVEEGEEVTADSVRSIRPAGGLPPSEWEKVIGRRFRKSARRGTPLIWDLI